MEQSLAKEIFAHPDDRKLTARLVGGNIMAVAHPAHKVGGKVISGLHRGAAACDRPCAAGFLVRRMRSETGIGAPHASRHRAEGRTMFPNGPPVSHRGAFPLHARRRRMSIGPGAPDCVPGACPPSRHGRRDRVMKRQGGANRQFQGGTKNE